MKITNVYHILAIILVSFFLSTPVVKAEIEIAKTPLVIQLTRSSENNGHRRAFFQIDKILSDIGENKLDITVVAYEDGIHALLADNKNTSQLLMKLSNRGVKFKACQISMRAWDLTADQFPLEVDFVPAGAPEVVKLQLQGYKYFKP